MVRLLSLTFSILAVWMLQQQQQYGCHAQRAITNFGTKVKNKESHSANTKNYIQEMDEFVIQDDQIVAKKGLESVDLAFEDILISLDTKKKGKRLLLDGSVSGRARPGRMLAIMGPSGAGKSTLLHAIAGRVKYSKEIYLSGKRYINGEPVTGDSQIPAAFVQQDVTFFPHLTVRETLNFRVALKLGSMLPKEARDGIVEDLMKQLGLTQSADTIVGDNKVRGISGGERKRLSIAVEMISSPSVIFLDEPTSGLDSAASAALISKLRGLADEGKTIIAVIHQPSQHVFGQFDDLLLVSKGKLVYYGEVNSVRSYMEYTAGLKAESKEVGTAEHILECISEIPMVGETSQDDVANRIAKLADLAVQQTKNLGISSEAKEVAATEGTNGNGEKNGKNSTKKTKLKRFKAGSHGPRANVLVQMKLLLVRSLKEAFRGKTTLIIKAVQQLTVGIIYGGIYNLGNNQASIQDRFGLLSLIAIGASNLAVATTIRTFPKEKGIVSSEIASKMYRTFPYFVGKAVSELPLVVFFNSLLGVSVYHLSGMNTGPGKFRNFLSLLSLHGLASQSLGLMLGAVSPSSDVALALFPAVLILNIIFDGRNISPENTPKALRWVAKVGLIRWGFEGMSINEFEGLEFDTSGPFRGPVVKTGKDALSRLGIIDTTLSDVYTAQGTLTGICWILSYLGIFLTRQKFAVMNPPGIKR